VRVQFSLTKASTRAGKVKEHLFTLTALFARSDNANINLDG